MTYQVKMIESALQLYVVRNGQEPINDNDTTLPDDLQIIGITDDFDMFTAKASGEYVGEVWMYYGDQTDEGPVLYESEDLRTAYAQYVARGGDEIKTYRPEDFYPHGYRFNTTEV